MIDSEYLRSVFTEQGVAMLSGVLRRTREVAVREGEVLTTDVILSQFPDISHMTKVSRPS